MKFKAQVVLVVFIVIVSGSYAIHKGMQESPNTESSVEKREVGCVFQTVFEGNGVEKDFYLPISDDVQTSCQSGLDWLVSAQHKSGGFGAGSHNRQNVKDPHQVEADPATTAMVSMAILREGSTLNQGPYSKQLTNATNFLLNCVEESSDEAANITELQNTQIQTKLGGYVDVILRSQYLTNLLDHVSEESFKERIEDAVSKCVKKIESNHESDGSVKASGWAGVLQSSFAANSLEAAKAKGIVVDDEVLKNSQQNQKKNFDVNSGTIATDQAAGVMLYSVSGSSRASAKEARKAKQTIQMAVDMGTLDSAAPVTEENLQIAGLDTLEAKEVMTSYDIYNASKVRAQSADVLQGFGNNGGEEFLSFLQTGEGLIVNKDMEWQQWYNSTSSRLMDIQNSDGSWSGHHCITSPVFCTATALLILSVNNDIDELVAQGDTQE